MTDPKYPLVPGAPHDLMQWFEYGHLPPKLHVASVPFCELARLVEKELPDNPEKDECLRKLLEAKDCAVRALLWRPPMPPVEASPVAKAAAALRTKAEEEGSR